MRALRFFETSGTTYPLRHHVNVKTGVEAMATDFCNQKMRCLRPVAIKPGRNGVLTEHTATEGNRMKC